MKRGCGLAAGLVIVLIVAIVVTAWIKGGEGPAQTVEIPVVVPGGGASGA